jgi:small subunit ribosomal protein S4
VNGEVVNIPSFSVKPGDVIAVREKSKSLTAITSSLLARSAKKYNWLEWDGKELSGSFISYPQRDQIPENIQEQLIVELYSK